jgi:hypothetical protein
MISVSICDIVQIPVSDLQDAIEDAEGAEYATIDINDSFHVYPEDIDDFDEDDLLSFYKELTDTQQSKFLESLKIHVSEEGFFTPKNIDEEMKFQAFQELQSKFSLEELIKRLS